MKVIMNLKSCLLFSVLTSICVKAMPFDVYGHGYVGHVIRDENYIRVKTAEGPYVITHYFDIALQRYIPFDVAHGVVPRVGDDSSRAYDHKDITQSSSKAWEKPKSHENQYKNFPSTSRSAQMRLLEGNPEQVNRKEKPSQSSQRQFQQQQQQPIHEPLYVNSRFDPSSSGSSNEQLQKKFNTDRVQEGSYGQNSATSSSQNTNKYKPEYSEESTTQKINHWNNDSDEESNEENQKWNRKNDEHSSSVNKNNQNQQNSNNNDKISFENNQKDERFRTTTVSYDYSQTDSQQSNDFNRYHDKDGRLTLPGGLNNANENLNIWGDVQTNSNGNPSNNQKNTEMQPFEATTSSHKPTWAPTVQPTVQQTSNVNKKPNTGLDFVLPDRKVEIEIEYPSPNYDIELTTRAPLPRPVISDKSSPLRPHSNQNPGNGKNPY